MIWVGYVAIVYWAQNSVQTPRRRPGSCSRRHRRRSSRGRGPPRRRSPPARCGR
ncbi:unnamed protein product [Spirodela intermedia]|uniref:Uncharacterized protein n=1 Tax=Spirodela intermedia TaxID=51605 RepID=A0A7I8J908_SPIIN|nr:unnamed protein product [Spirodela intermedia]CAA6666574.1 unnamed protein product [Spirodela intermedia]